jgi:hypothetical protein
MTLLNSSYTTLEEAWGKQYTSKPKKTKKKKENIDPLCELYGQRLKKIKKPFSDNKSTLSEQFKPFDGGDESYYYGYDDDHKFKRMNNKERQKTGLLMVNEEDEQCFKTIPNNSLFVSPKLTRQAPKPSSVRFEELDEEFEQEDYKQEDDEIYTENIFEDNIPNIFEEDNDYEDNIDFNEVLNSKQNDFEKVYTNVYDETEDETENSNDDRIDKKTIRDKHMLQQTVNTPFIEEELKRCNYMNDRKQRNCEFRDERHYLDLVIYVLSGIILIFMMEQFIQIGMRLRPYY